MKSVDEEFLQETEAFIDRSVSRTASPSFNPASMDNVTLAAATGRSCASCPAARWPCCVYRTRPWFERQAVVVASNLGIAIAVKAL